MLPLGLLENNSHEDPVTLYFTPASAISARSPAGDIRFDKFLRPIYAANPPGRRCTASPTPPGSRRAPQATQVEFFVEFFAEHNEPVMSRYRSAAKTILFIKEKSVQGVMDITP